MSDGLLMEMSLRFFAEVTLKATAILVVAIGAGWALEWGSAATRRRMWAGVIVALLLLPVLAATTPPLRVLPLPAWGPRQAPSTATFVGPGSGRRAPVPGSDRGARAAGAQPSPETQPLAWGEPLRPATSPLSPVWMGVALFYLAGLVVSLQRLLRARLRVRRLLRGAGHPGRTWEIPSGVKSLESDAISLPLTLGSWRSVVLLPRSGSSWPADWRAAVVAHEAAHVRGRDPLWQLLGEVATVLYWFHPLVHLAVRQLRIERELAADDATLATGIRPSVYARVLFELACIPEQPARLGAVVPLLTPGGLKARVRALLESGRSRQASRRVALLLALAGAVTVLPLAAAVPTSTRSGILIGRLVDAQERPVAGAEVNFQPDGRDPNVEPWNEMVVSDNDGWFRYPAAAPWQDAFDVFARKGSLVARRGILAVRYGTALPTTMELRRGHTLSGTVRDDTGRALVGATVRIVDDTNVAPGPGPQVLAWTDRAGRWRIEGMLYGDFQLLVQARSGVATTVSTRIEAVDVTGLDAVVPREWPVTGWLVDEQGRRLANTRVEHHRTRSRPRDWATPREWERHLDWDETAGDGSFRILPRGQNVPVEGRDVDGHELFGYFHDGGDRPFFGRQSFPASWNRIQPRSAPVDVLLTRNARVTGFLRSSTGAGVPGVHLLVSKVARSGLPPFQAALIGRTTTTDAAGRFDFSVPSGLDVHLVALGLTPDGHRVHAETSLRLEPGEDRQGVEMVVRAVNIR